MPTPFEIAFGTAGAGQATATAQPEPQAAASLTPFQQAALQKPEEFRSPQEKELLRAPGLPYAPQKLPPRTRGEKFVESMGWGAPETALGLYARAGAAVGLDTSDAAEAYRLLQTRKEAEPTLAKEGLGALKNPEWWKDVGTELIGSSIPLLATGGGAAVPRTAGFLAKVGPPALRWGAIGAGMGAAETAAQPGTTPFEIALGGAESGAMMGALPVAGHLVGMGARAVLRRAGILRPPVPEIPRFEPPGIPLAQPGMAAPPIEGLRWSTPTGEMLPFEAKAGTVPPIQAPGPPILPQIVGLPAPTGRSTRIGGRMSRIGEILDATEPKVAQEPPVEAAKSVPAGDISEGHIPSKTAFSAPPGPQNVSPSVPALRGPKSPVEPPQAPNVAPAAAPEAPGRPPVVAAPAAKAVPQEVPPAAPVTQPAKAVAPGVDKTRPVFDTGGVTTGGAGRQAPQETPRPGGGEPQFDSQRHYDIRSWLMNRERAYYNYYGPNWSPPESTTGAAPPTAQELASWLPHADYLFRKWDPERADLLTKPTWEYSVAEAAGIARAPIIRIRKPGVGSIDGISKDVTEYIAEANGLVVEDHPLPRVATESEPMREIVYTLPPENGVVPHRYGYVLTYSSGDNPHSDWVVSSRKLTADAAADQILANREHFRRLEAKYHLPPNLENIALAAQIVEENGLSLPRPNPAASGAAGGKLPTPAAVPPPPVLPAKAKRLARIAKRAAEAAPAQPAPGPAPEGKQPWEMTAQEFADFAIDGRVQRVSTALLGKDATVAQRLVGGVTIQGRAPKKAPRTPAEGMLLPDGTIRITDGSHRIAGAIARGEKDFPVRVRPAAGNRSDYAALAKLEPPPEPARPEAAAAPEGRGEAKGVRRATYQKASIESAVAAAQRFKSDKSKFIYATSEGLVIKDAPPPFNQAYTEVQPGGKVVTHSPTLGEPAPPEPARDLLGKPTFEKVTGKQKEMGFAEPPKEPGPPPEAEPKGMPGEPDGYGLMPHDYDQAERILSAGKWKPNAEETLGVRAWLAGKAAPKRKELAGTGLDWASVAGGWSEAERIAGPKDRELRAWNASRTTMEGEGGATLLDDIEAAKARAKKSATGGVSGIGLGPLNDAVDLGYLYIKKGLRNFAAWAKQMVADLGERIRPHLRRVWARAMRLYREETASTFPREPGEEPREPTREELEVEAAAEAEREMGREVIEPPEAEAEKPAGEPYAEAAPAGKRVSSLLRSFKPADMPRMVDKLNAVGERDLNSVPEVEQALKSMREATRYRKEVEGQAKPLIAEAPSRAQTPLLDWMRSTVIDARKGAEMATEIKEACAGRPYLRKFFDFTGKKQARGIDGAIIDAKETAESGFKGDMPSDFLDQLVKEADAAEAERMVAGDVGAQLRASAESSRDPAHLRSLADVMDRAIDRENKAQTRVVEAVEPYIMVRREADIERLEANLTEARKAIESETAKARAEERATAATQVEEVSKKYETALREARDEIGKIRRETSAARRLGKAEAGAAGVRTRLIALVEKLPPEVKQKMFRRVSRARTTSQLESALSLADKYFEEHLKRSVIDRIQKTAGKFGKVAPYMHTEEAKALLSEARNMRGIGRRNLMGRELDELESIDARLAEGLYQTQEAGRLLVGEKRQAVDDAVREFVGEIEGRTKPLPERYEMAGFARRAWRWMVRHGIQHTPNNLLAVSGEGGTGKKVFDDRIWDGVNASRKETLGSDKRLRKACSDAGFPWHSKELATYLDEPVTMELPEAGRRTMSRAHWIDLYLDTLDPHTSRELEKAGFRTRERLAEHHIPMPLEAQDFVGASLDVPTKKFAEALGAALREPGERMSAVNRQLTGRDLEIRPAWWSILRDYWLEHFQYEPVFWHQFGLRLKETMGIAKPRTGGGYSVVVENAFEKYLRVARQQASFIGLGEPLRDAAMVAGHPEFKQAVVRNLGADWLKELDRYLNAVSNMGGRPMSPLETAMEGWLKMAAGGLLANPWSALRQLDAPAFVAGKMDTAYLLKGMAAAASHAKQSVAEMTEHSPGAWLLYNETPYSLVTPPIGERYQRYGRKPLREYLMSPLIMGDKLGRAQVWEAVKAETEALHPEFKAGTPEYWESVAKRFDRLSDETQPTDNPQFLPGLARAARGSPALRPIVFLQSQNAQVLNRLIESVTRFRQNPTAPGALKALLVSLAAMGIVSPAYQVMVNKAREKVYAGFQPQKNAPWGGVAMDMVETNLSNVYLLGDLVHAARSKSGDMRGSPWGEVAQGGMRGFGDVMHALNQWKDDDPKARATGLRAAERLARSIGTLVGVPVAFPLGLGKGIYRMGGGGPADDEVDALQAADESEPVAQAALERIVRRGWTLAKARTIVRSRARREGWAPDVLTRRLTALSQRWRRQQRSIK